MIETVVDGKTRAYALCFGRDSETYFRKLGPAGQATQFQGENYYILQLNMFPGASYYMRKVDDSMSRYTVFAKREHRNGVPRLSNPVGTAHYLSSVNPYLKIRFDLFNRPFYMDLFESQRKVPENSNLTAGSITGELHA